MSRLAVLHPTSLVGKELREILDDRSGLGDEVRLLSTESEDVGTLTESRGEVTFVQKGSTDELEGVDLAFFCGGLEESRPLLEALPAGTTAILLAPEATAADGRPVVAGINSAAAERGAVILSPHPGAVLLAHLLAPLTRFELREAVATLVLPVSLFGDPGLDDLFGQTREILTMSGDRPPGLFGHQLAFNLLPGRIAGSEVAAQVEAVVSGGPRLAVQALQGAVFHGVGASLFVRPAEAPAVEDLRQALAGSSAVELFDQPELLGPIDAAAQDAVLVGAVAKAAEGGFWLWAVMDNLTRGAALNAAEVAEAVLS